MTLTMRFLHTRIVRILVGNEISSLDIAAVRILALPVEDFLVKLDVVVVYRVVEGDSDHLRHILGREITGDDGTVLRAEAVRQHALRRITRRCAIWVVVDICNRELTL